MFLTARLVHSLGHPAQEAAEEAEAEEAEEDTRPLPKSKFVPPKPLSTEEYGSGANKKVYFVCSEAGEAWTVLPMVRCWQCPQPQPTLLAACVAVAEAG